MTSTEQSLIIVESPAKCSKIESFLGSKYKCIASYGHIRELKKDNTAYDEKNNFKPMYQIIKERKEYVENIRPLFKRYKNIFIATDDDREGEAIGWHICKVFKLSLKTTKRIIFNSITKNAIIDALRKPVKIDMNIVYAQRARQILDQMLGFKVTPILWKHVSHTAKLSAGRCQTPALRLIYDRYLYFKNNQKDITFEVKANFVNNINFLFDSKFKKSEDLKDFLEKSKDFDHILDTSKEKEGFKSPPKPLTTSILQQRASNELNMTPKQTMRSAQILYEQGFITYMRTDSTKYSREFINNVNKLITKDYGINYVKVEYRKEMENHIENSIVIDVRQNTEEIKDKNLLVQGAHEAIRPTKHKLKFLKENAKIKYNEVKLYALIYNTSIESCMASCNLKRIIARVNSPLEGKYYKHCLEKVVFPGWKIVKGFDADNTNYDNFLKIKGKLKVKYNVIEGIPGISHSKSHYTEASLIKMLEKEGIEDLLLSHPL